LVAPSISPSRTLANNSDPTSFSSPTLLSLRSAAALHPQNVADVDGVPFFSHPSLLEYEGNCALAPSQMQKNCASTSSPPLRAPFLPHHQNYKALLPTPCPFRKPFSFPPGFPPVLIPPFQLRGTDKVPYFALIPVFCITTPCQYFFPRSLPPPGLLHPTRACVRSCRRPTFSTVPCASHPNTRPIFCADFLFLPDPRRMSSQFPLLHQPPFTNGFFPY